MPVTAIAWLFPDGRLPGPRWRPYAVAAAAAFGALVAISPFQAERFSAEVAGVASPLPQWSWLEVPSMLACSVRSRR